VSEDPEGTVRRPSGPPAGLCAACRHSHRIETRGGSVFRLCERSLTDPAYARYPVLPMLRCTGFEPIAEGEQGPQP
jgi:hypothetical protein